MSHGKRDDQTQSSQHGESGRRIAGRAQDDHRGDPYHATGKLTEPTACPECRAVYQKGRWQWGDAEPGAHQVLCPACRRIQDSVPAGVVTLSGDYVRSHREELVRNIRAQEQTERAEHPMNRIIDLINSDDGMTIEVTTTDIHLPRRIGESIERANGGTLKETYDDNGYFVRVDWKRDK
jgi:hypothetical protein